MERFKQAVFDLAGPLSPEKISLIERRLLELNPVSITAPSHPTYAAMILRALTELNEEGGSNEIRISEFIRAEYNDLPWAHSRLLRHHLVMLCENGEISVSSSGFYHILSSETSESELEKESEPEGPKKLMWWRGPWNQRRERKKCQMLKKVRKGKKRKEGVELIKGGSLKRKKNAAYEGNSVAGKIKVAVEDNQRSRRRSSRLRHIDVVDAGNQKPARPRMTQCKDSPVNKQIEQDGMEKHYNKRKQCQKESNEQHELLPPQQERLPTTIPDAETTEGEEKQRKTRPRGPPKPNLEAEESAHKSVSSDNHHSDDKQQQPFKRRGRPPKAKVKEDKTDCMLQSGHLKIDKEQQQSLSPRRRGRPPKHKLSTAASDLMLLEQGNELKQQEQSQGRRRGRPPKQKTSTTAGELALLPQENELPLQQQQPGQGGTA